MHKVDELASWSYCPSSVFGDIPDTETVHLLWFFILHCEVLVFIHRHFMMKMYNCSSAFKHTDSPD
jgi:hypothetical protein